MITLRTKIIVSLISMSLLTIAVGGVVERGIIKDRFDQIMINRAVIGFRAEAVAYYRAYGSWEAAVEAESFAAFGARMRPSNVTVFDSSAVPPPARPGQFASGSVPQGAGAQGPMGGIGSDSAPTTGGAPDFLLADLDGTVWIAGRGKPIGEILSPVELKNTFPLFDGDEQIAYVRTLDRVVMSDLETQYLQSMTDSIWISLLVVGALAIPLGVFLGVKLSSPIKKLQQAVVAMQPGQVRQEVQITSTDEIGQLSQSFNVMSSEMASFVQIIEAQKAKILETEALRKEGMASISHELRTPLNNCVAQANAMLDGVRPTDAEQVALLSGALDHLTKLVDDLFQLSLADVDALECDKETVDLCSIVEDVIDARQPDFVQKGSKIQSNIPVHLKVLGDSKRLRQIFDNLLENCFRYSDPKGIVEVSIEQKGAFGVLIVSDDGPGVPEDQLGAIFDRFYREDSSRIRKISGTGLGLSLVKVWVEAQGGSVEASLSPKGGLQVQVSIPVADSRSFQRVRSVA